LGFGEQDAIVVSGVRLADICAAFWPRVSSYRSTAAQKIERFSRPRKDT
jgi:hypothetical protein